MNGEAGCFRKTMCTISDSHLSASSKYNQYPHHSPSYSSYRSSTKETVVAPTFTLQRDVLMRCYQADSDLMMRRRCSPESEKRSSCQAASSSPLFTTIEESFRKKCRVEAALPLREEDDPPLLHLKEDLATTFYYSEPLFSRAWDFLQENTTSDNDTNKEEAGKGDHTLLASSLSAAASVSNFRQTMKKTRRRSARLTASPSSSSSPSSSPRMVRSMPFMFGLSALGDVHVPTSLSSNKNQVFSPSPSCCSQREISWNPFLASSTSENLCINSGDSSTVHSGSLRRGPFHTTTTSPSSSDKKLNSLPSCHF